MGPVFNPVAWCAVLLIMVCAASVLQALWGVLPALRTWVAGTSWHAFLSYVGVPVVVGVIICIALLAIAVTCGWFWMIQAVVRPPNPAA